MTFKNILLVFIVFGICYGINDSRAEESTADSTLQKKFGDYSAMGKLDELKSMLAISPSLVHSKINGKQNQRPLHWSCLNGDPEVVKFLIRNGAEVNAKDAQGMTPLHWAAWQGQIEAAKILVSFGAELNTKNISGHTPLDRAIFDNHSEMVEYLRSIGAKKGKELPR